MFGVTDVFREGESKVVLMSIVGLIVFINKAKDVKFLSTDLL